MGNKAYKYYQPNEKDLKDRQGDCAIRAMTKFFGISWREAFDRLVDYARESQTMINSLTNIRAYMEDHGIPYESIYEPKARKKTTVSMFVKDHKQGMYILYVRSGYQTHLVAVQNGQYFDTWNCGNKIVYGYWSKQENR